MEVSSQPSPSAETESLLARLAQRSGVQGTLILARDTGSIVRSSGLVTNDDIADEETRPPTSNGADAEPKRKGTRKADEVARLVYKFVQSASEMVEDLNGEHDESKLLRVRTRKNEVVIVPGTSETQFRKLLRANRRTDARFLLVVIHDTPPAP